MSEPWYTKFKKDFSEIDSVWQSDKDNLGRYINEWRRERGPAYTEERERLHRDLLANSDKLLAEYDHVIKKLPTGPVSSVKDLRNLGNLREKVDEFKPRWKAIWDGYRAGMQDMDAQEELERSLDPEARRDRENFYENASPQQIKARAQQEIETINEAARQFSQETGNSEIKDDDLDPYLPTDLQGIHISEAISRLQKFLNEK